MAAVNRRSNAARARRKSSENRGCLVTLSSPSLWACWRQSPSHDPARTSSTPRTTSTIKAATNAFRAVCDCGGRPSAYSTQGRYLIRYPTRYFGNVETVVQTYLSAVWVPSTNFTDPIVDPRTEIVTPPVIVQRVPH